MKASSPAHQMGEVNDALALKKALRRGRFGSLNELWSGITKPHSAPVMPGFALGGLIDVGSIAHAVTGTLGDIASTVGGAAADLIGKFAPVPTGLGFLKPVFEKLMEKIGTWIAGNPKLTGGGWHTPLSTGAAFSLGRIDHGRDYETQPGSHELALSSGNMTYPGTFPGYGGVLAMDQAWRGLKNVYYGHARAGLGKHRVVAGEPVATAGGVGAPGLPGHVEIGFATSPSGGLFGTQGHAAGPEPHGSDMGALLHKIDPGHFQGGGLLRQFQSGGAMAASGPHFHVDPHKRGYRLMRDRVGLLYLAGLRGADAVGHLAAKSQGESAGRTDAVGDAGDSIGLWQIDTAYHNYSKSALQDPLYNAKAAVAIYRSQGIGAWHAPEQAVGTAMHYARYGPGAYTSGATGPSLTAGYNIFTGKVEHHDAKYWREYRAHVARVKATDRSRYNRLVGNKPAASAAAKPAAIPTGEDYITGLGYTTDFPDLALATARAPTNTTLQMATLTSQIGRDTKSITDLETYLQLYQGIQKDHYRAFGTPQNKAFVDAAVKAIQGQLASIYQDRTTAQDTLTGLQHPYGAPGTYDELDYAFARAALTGDTGAEASVLGRRVALDQAIIKFGEGGLAGAFGPITDPGQRAAIQQALTAAYGDLSSTQDQLKTISPAATATGAAEAFAAFTQNRSDLFRTFGRNFVPAGANAFGDQTQQAAGLRDYGAASGPTINTYFAAPPPDPHQWAQQQRFAALTAFG